jgi:hypothetical protein
MFQSAASQAMFTERSRTHPGFADLPSVADGIATGPPAPNEIRARQTEAMEDLTARYNLDETADPQANPWAPRAGDQPPFNPPQPAQLTQQAAHHQQQQITQQDPPLQPPAAQTHLTTSIPNPGDWYTQHGSSAQPPPPASTSQPNYRRLSAADLATIRACLPNIAQLSDEAINSTDMQLLIKLNAGAKDSQNTDINAAVIAAAAAAAQFSGFAPAAQDPGVKMAKNLEKLRANPTLVSEGYDDRISVLHSARFLGGMVASGTNIWLMARDIIGLEGLVPLANYDLACIGLHGSVSTRGCIEAHNPGSTNLCLKMFSPVNISTTAGAARKFTLADDDGAVSVGEHMQEIKAMNTFEHAIRALCGITRLIMPWNLSFEAINGFLHATSFGLPELENDPDRVGKLVRFVNYVLGMNAASWQRKEPFLTCGALKQEFGTYLHCQAAGAPKHVAMAATYQPATQPQNKNIGGGGGGNRGGRFSRPFYGSGYQGQGGGQGRGGQHFGGGSQHGGRGGQQGGGGANMVLCQNFNKGTCQNHYSNCHLWSGLRVFHLCSARKADGKICRERHPANQHH